jgi:hypothetical protein
MSKKYLVAILSEPTAGQETEYNEYYENLHLDEVLQTTGFTSARRFRLAAEAGGVCPLPYLAVYETTGDDAESVLKRINDTRGQRQQSRSINKRTAAVWIFEAIGPEHSA